MAKIIAITGGIGAGKSVVSNILRYEGFSVYDCDSQAKMLMDNDDLIKKLLVERIHCDSVVDGIINRRLIAEIVFNDAEKLTVLNNIVHEAVRQHLSKWIASKSNEKALFVETAILYQSGIDKMADEVWTVTAPTEVRIKRVIRRNSLEYSEVQSRISAQDSYISASIHPYSRIINNDGVAAVLPQIKQLLAAIE